MSDNSDNLPIGIVLLNTDSEASKKYQSTEVIKENTNTTLKVQLSWFNIGVNGKTHFVRAFMQIVFVKCW